MSLKGHGWVFEEVVGFVVAGNAAVDLVAWSHSRKARRCVRHPAYNLVCWRFVEGAAPDNEAGFDEPGFPDLNYC